MVLCNSSYFLLSDFCLSCRFRKSDMSLFSLCSRSRLSKFTFCPEVSGSSSESAISQKLAIFFLLLHQKNNQIAMYLSLQSN
ncbi:hypothetical protein HanIR_Chr17g0875811 [Helianthus annuus]|nr:hypothetical protein HanIR_Chr17g0875811 [Helianthus annuus]